MIRLLNFIPAPRNPKETGTPKSWEKIEARLGLKLPWDYKHFIDHYGTGSFDDFIMVYNFFADTEYLNPFYALDTLHQADQQIRLLADSAWTVVHPFKLYPGTEGLLPWGSTVNFSYTFFWQIKGAPESWETIFYNLRSGEYEVWKYPLTEFLYQLITHQIESVLLPPDFLSPDISLTFIPAHS